MAPLDDCTPHARVRMQQRGISADALDLLLSYGRASYGHDGRLTVYMDRRARDSAIRDCGRAAAPTIDRIGSLFAVLGTDGAVVTVGHRCRRINRH